MDSQELNEFSVTITETLVKVVKVQAHDVCEAEEIAEERWNNEEYVLDAGNFTNASFAAFESKKEA